MNVWLNQTFRQVSILPLRLHVDQDTLTFMNEFSSALAEAGCSADGLFADAFFF